MVSNTASIYETEFNSAVYNIPIKALKSIRDSSGTIDNDYEFVKSFAVSIGTNGQFSIATGAVDETFPYSAGALNDTQKTDKFNVIMNTATAVSLSGTVTGTSNTYALVGSSTAFTTQLREGDDIKIGSQIYTVDNIADNTHLTTVSKLTTNYSGSAIKRFYDVGKMIDFTQKGATNVERSITINSSTSASFDFKETFDATSTATVMCSLTKSNVQEKKKIRKHGRYVKINLPTHTANTVGPWCIGVSDLYKVNSIRKRVGTFITANDGTDVTSDFIIDYGQRDSHYGLSWISLKPGVTVANTEHLLLNIDYFTHDTSQGKGYLSIDSYPIDDVNTANTNAIQTKDVPVYNSLSLAKSFDLRDCIDMRPKITNTATDTTSLGSATVNPSDTEVMEVSVGGLYTPFPNETFTMDLSYYLKRRDLVVMDLYGNYKIIRGVPALSPITPNTPDDSMALASVYIPPYPSLPSDQAAEIKRGDYAVSITPRKYKRYTMRDIGVIDQSVKNLQYYMTLSLLEKKATDFKILDDVGLDRFKNGILVDAFTGTNIADVNSLEFKCSIDPSAKECRPLFDLQNTKLVYDSVNSTNIAKTGSLLTLPYTHTECISQTFASTTKNSSGYLYNWKGFLSLFPQEDFWVDTTRSPDLTVNIDTNADAWVYLANQIKPSPWQTQWNDWQTIWTGENSVSTDVNTVHEYYSGSDYHSDTTIQQLTTTTNIDRILERTGITQGFVRTDQPQSLGDRVTDTSLIPYMRPRTVFFVAHRP